MNIKGVVCLNYIKFVNKVGRKNGKIVLFFVIEEEYSPFII